MNSHEKSFIRLFSAVMTLTVVLAGCAPEQPEPVKRICPGKASAAEALATLKKYSMQSDRFIAYGEGRASFYVEDKDKPQNERVPAVKLWFDPPGKVRFWGEVAFNRRGLDVGSNDTEFWFAAKPKEIGNTYIWGLWSEQERTDNILLSPGVLRQAFGLIDVDRAENWSLSSARNEDVLTQNDEQGHPVKRIYITNCDYRVRRIEYLDAGRRITAALELADYKDLNQMSIPAKMKFLNPNDDGTVNTFEIILKSIKPADTIKDAVFKRPDTRGFKEVYRMVDGKAIEQPGSK